MGKDKQIFNRDSNGNHKIISEQTRQSTQQNPQEQQAIELINQGDFKQAELVCLRQIKKDNSDHEAHFFLGLSYKKQKKLKQAILAYKAAIKIQPNFFEAYFNLGTVLSEYGKPSIAVKAFKRALELKPRHFNTYFNLSRVLWDCGSNTAAIQTYKEALKLEPNNASCYNNMGIAMVAKKDINDAIEAYRNAIEIKPNYAEAHNNLGIALHEKDDLNAALISFKNALKFKPTYSDAHNNLGNIFRELGQINESIDHHRKSIELRPKHPESHKNLAHSLLLSGDYESGLSENEWRLHQKHQLLYARPKCQKWYGSTLPKNQKLLLVSEQGLGDTLQFMRYAAALKKEGFLVSLCAPQKLHSLIQVSGIDPSPLSPDQANQIEDGQWTPLLSVPQYLGVCPSNPIITNAYIRTSDELILKWCKLLSSERRPIIGINWQGNPKNEKRGSLARSLTIESFSPIISNNNISLLSLQKGFGSEQLERSSFKSRFVKCQHQVSQTWDFLETAAIIANCDLVITSDTSVAHLAGGMGKTTWLLLKKIPEWRWGLEGDRTFWYPSIKLFRQAERGDWNELMQRVAQELQKFF